MSDMHEIRRRSVAALQEEDAMLCIRNLTHRFGDKEVLRGVDLSVPRGSVFGFIGQNGAGKTTTMKAILGLLAPDEGEILVSGERVCFGQTATNRYVGYLPDVPEFYGFMTAREYLMLCGECLAMPRGELNWRIEELLSLVGLLSEKHRIKGFSRGMKQRLGIAGALLGKPRLLICDEPTSALDPLGRKEILELLASVREQTTVLFSTHILSDVERICTDIAFLHQGRIVLKGSAKELKQCRQTREFVLTPACASDRDVLLEAFPKHLSREEDHLVFLGEEADQFELLHFVSEKRIPLEQWERREVMLEKLFMEVVR